MFRNRHVQAKSKGPPQSSSAALTEILVFLSCVYLALCWLWEGLCWLFSHGVVLFAIACIAVASFAIWKGTKSK